MRKVIAAINMTLDGFSDHTAVIADDELHEHFNDLLLNAGTLLYGRITYQLMENYWPALVKNPSGNKSSDDFAVLINDIQKVVYSRTLTSVDWNNSLLKHELNKDDIVALKHQPGAPIFAGSPSMIVALTQLKLIDEYQLVLHPVVAGSGLPLFKNIQESISLNLLKTKKFKSGALALYYEPSPK